MLPSQWIVCSMSIDIERDELIFSRYESSHPSPMLLRLPLKRRDSSLLSYSTARDTLSKILSASNESAKVAKDINAKSQKQEWWKMRKALDDQLGHLLKEMDDMWIGGFKGVFSMIDYDSDLLMAFKSELDIILSGFVSAVSRSKKAIAVHPEICGLMLGLDVDASSDDFEDVLLYILDSRMYYDVTAHASAEDAGFNTVNRGNSMPFFVYYLTPNLTPMLVLDGGLYSPGHFQIQPSI